MIYNIIELHLLEDTEWVVKLKITNNRVLEHEHNRVISIDILRAIVMILMVLDHTRGSWNGGTGINPTDLVNTYPALFFTRWITHFCAPIFVILTGMSAYISKKNNSKSNKLCFSLLVKRGLLLILLELTVLSIFWGGTVLQVIWVIGVSMIILSILQFFPSRLVGILGLLLITFHNLIPEFNSSDIFSNLLLSILHQSKVIKISSQYEISVLYPLIPWIGVMALGYSLGEIYFWEKSSRGKFLKTTGSIFIGLLIILRLFNIYGNPVPFQVQESFAFTIISFLNLEKYPPSFLYLMMTIGPMFLMLIFLERFKPQENNPLIIFGRTPLFFYIVHLFLILFVSATFRDILGYNTILFSFSLIFTYIVWVMMLVILYPICKYYYKLKFLMKLRWTKYL